MIETSILDRMCAPLCEALTGLDDPQWNGQACLEWMEDANLFMVPLDGQRIWYRFHHLFREFLRNHLDTEIHSRSNSGVAQPGINLVGSEWAG